MGWWCGRDDRSVIGWVVAVATDPPGDGGNRDLEPLRGPPIGPAVVDDGVDEALSSRRGQWCIEL